MKARKPLIILLLALFIYAGNQSLVNAQVSRVAAGLSFATGVDFNTITNGNPGLKIKTWIALNRDNNLHVVPTITAYAKNAMDAGYFTINNRLLTADLDGQYTIFREGTIKIIAFAGLNCTYIISDVKENDSKFPLEIYAPYAPGNDSDYAFGGNIGAGLEMRMASRFDMNLQVKYILSRYSQAIISVEGVYYFKSRRRVQRR